ncbi:MAG: ribosomal large subunit pseudouridine synthase B, partial [Alishewanella aestuarii]
EDRTERRRRLASMKRAVRKHQIAEKTPGKKTEPSAKANRAEPAKKPTATKGQTGRGNSTQRQPTGKTPTREGRG